MYERLASVLLAAKSIPPPASRRKERTPEQKARNNRQCIERVRNDPALRLTGRMRCRLSAALRTNVIEGPKTAAMVGCSVPALREYIEGLWRPGMTWENYGPAWCIDHIRPCSSFDMLDPEQQQRACFHYTNLQPLWTLENQRKGDKQCSPAWW